MDFCEKMVIKKQSEKSKKKKKKKKHWRQKNTENQSIASYLIEAEWNKYKKDDNGSTVFFVHMKL